MTFRVRPCWSRKVTIALRTPRPSILVIRPATETPAAVVARTVCDTPAEVGLAMKLLLPLYLAVIDLTPGVVLVMLQVVAGKVAVHVCEPSLTVTVPPGAVGKAEPGAVTDNVKLTG